MPDSPDSDVTMGIIRRAMALRVKYRVASATGAKKRRIPLALMGVHNMNRGGVYPNGERVANLAVELLKAGFSEEEANHEGVCVQEVPATERKHDPVYQKPYLTYAQYNLLGCAQPALKTCFTDGSEKDTMHGTLAHGHLLLVLLGLQTGATWALPEDLGKKLLDQSGAIDFAAVAAYDPAVAALCRDGLEMEVLSWRLYMEEPGACSLISQALNKGSAMALQTTELTALAVLTGEVTLAHESAVAEDIALETVKEKVRHELDVFVDLPDFVELFEFIINMGAGKEKFVQQLLEFGSRFVDGKTRRLRLAAFAVANKMQNDFPRCKIAMLMRSYRKKPDSYGWCPCPEGLWTRKRGRAPQLANLLGNYLIL